MQEYDIFYRVGGIRIPQHMLTPRLMPIDRFEFPKDSIFHYIGKDKLDIGPASDYYFIKNVSKVIPMHHVEELKEFTGNPKPVAAAIAPEIRKYHSQNRRFRRSYNPEMNIKDRNTLMIYNYGFLQKSYRYVRSVYAKYYRWYNIQVTAIKTLNEIAKRSDRNQFIILGLPKILPSVATLNKFKFGVNQILLKTLTSSESLMILELWKWMDKDVRDQSIFNHLEPESLSKINIVYQESGNYFVINLGRLNSWRFTGEDEKQKVKISPLQLQKSFLRLLMILMETRTVEIDTRGEELKEEDDYEDIEAKQNEIPKADDDDDDDEGTTESKPETTDLDDQAYLEEMKRKYPDSILTEDDRIDLPEEDTTPDTDEDNKKTTGKKTEPQVDTLPVDPEMNEMLSRQKEMQEVLDNLDEDLKQLEAIEEMVLAKQDEEKKEATYSTDEPINVEEFGEMYTPEALLIELSNELAEDGLMTAAEYKRKIKSAENYKKIQAPGRKETLDTFTEYKREEIILDEPETIPDMDAVLDKTMLQSSLLDFDKRYVDNVLDKDVAKMVVGSQKSGAILTNYEVEKVETVQGDYEMHTMRIEPIIGKPSTLRFRLPKIDHEGNFTSNGVKYKLRKQRVDLPIRKTAPDTVSLTSYYSKTFVYRSTKKVNDYGNWLRNKIMLKGLDENDKDIIEINPGDSFDHLYNAPFVYTSIAKGFRSFKTKDYFFVFDHIHRQDWFGTDAWKKLENKSFIVVAQSTKKTHYLLMDKNGTLYSTENNSNTPVGNIEKMINLDTVGAPVDYTEVKIFGKNIPVALILAYKLGLSKLLELLKVIPRRVQAGARLNLEPDEWTMVFSDETLIFSRQDRLATLILAGLASYKALRNYSVYAFDKKDVYLNVLESTGLSNRYMREIDLMDDMFVDPITDEILMEMKEPRTFRGLLVRASELLLIDNHPDAMDMRYMRIRGYERLAGAVYTEVVQSVRDQRSKLSRANSQIELHPYAVWKRIVEDPSKSTINEINPVQDLKESEAVTFSGTGGRSSRSMTKSTRRYHKNDMGVISEATVDSSDVGINTYLSADPKFRSLRGTTKAYDFEKDGATSLVSTSALLSVGADKDDGKRVNFISIQNGHTMACKGYKPTPVRTGYEQVLAQRVGDMFATAARDDGQVLSVGKEGMIVQYKDGEKRGIEIGRLFGQASGLTVPHDVIANVKVGDTFKKGDILAYNTGFFEPDPLNPRNVIWKAGVIMRTALMESNMTLEDGSAISRRASDLMETKKTSIRTLVVTFDQSVSRLLKPGTKVEPEDILCIIEDAVTSNADLFDEESLNTLKVLSNQAPSAKVKGVIDRIEVYYHGALEDMSDSLRELAIASDKEMIKRNRSHGRTAFTGSVTDDFRVDGTPLNLDTMAIRIYITADVVSSVGDKLVFANQLKSIIGKVYQEEITTESGEVVDAIFGQKSIRDRIVNSPEIIGTTNTLLRIIGEKASEIYFKGQ